MAKFLPVKETWHGIISWIKKKSVILKRNPKTIHIHFVTLSLFSKFQSFTKYAVVLMLITEYTS